MTSCRSVLILWICATAACRGPGVEQPATTVADSAGVRIVEHPVGLTLASWGLAGAPEAVIGGASRDEAAHQFTEVRGGARLSNGRIVVADWGTKEARYFDRHGAHLATVGGGGEGPGEIRFLFSVDRVTGDSVVVGGWPIGSRYWFDEHGGYVRADAFGPWFPGMLGRTLVDGSLIIDTYANGSLGNTVETWAATGAEDEIRPVGVVELVSREGVVVDTLGAIEGATRRKSGRYPETFAAHELPFSPVGLVTWSHDRVFMGVTANAEIRAFDLGGALRTIVRWTYEPVAVTAADREAFETDVVDGLRNPARAPHFRRWLSEITYPDRKPAFAAMIADEEGRLWVRDHARAEATEADWTVMARTAWPSRGSGCRPTWTSSTWTGRTWSGAAPKRWTSPACSCTAWSDSAGARARRSGRPPRSGGACPQRTGQLSWSSISSTSMPRSCSTPIEASGGTVTRWPATWMRKGFPLSIASASRRSFSTNCFGG